MSSVTESLVQVVLLEVPVSVWARTQEHTDELIREFALIAAGEHDPGAAAVPARLTELIDAVGREFAGIGDEQADRLSTAAAAGVETIPRLVYRVPPSVADAVRHLGAMLDEADAYCRAGQHLLTLATPPDLLRFRNWFLEEFARQVAGDAPVPWPQYQG